MTCGTATAAEGEFSVSVRCTEEPDPALITNVLCRVVTVTDTWLAGPIAMAPRELPSADRNRPVDGSNTAGVTAALFSTPAGPMLWIVLWGRESKFVCVIVAGPIVLSTVL